MRKQTQDGPPATTTSTSKSTSTSTDHAVAGRQPVSQTLLPRTSLAAQSFSKPSFAPENRVPGFTTSFDTSGKGGGAFRDISANFNINEANGTASVSLPIPTSPARGDIKPDLTLTYDSGAGNGICGFGWNISPVPEAVTRKTSDGFPTYTEQDGFIYRGSELVLGRNAKGAVDVREDSDHQIRTYRPRVDNGEVRIEQWRNRHDATDIHWRVISAVNTVYIYGEDDNSRILDDTGLSRRISSWMLKRSYDSWGNAVEYTYKQEDGAGLLDSAGALPLWERNRPAHVRQRQKYPKCIRYGNVTGARDMDTWKPGQWPTHWLFHVVLDYGDHDQEHPASSPNLTWPPRLDAFSSTSAGYEIRSYRLCRRVLVFHQYFSDDLKKVEATHLITSVELQYDESAQRSLLSRCTVNGHTDKGGHLSKESLPPWDFTYNELPTPEQMNSTTIMASSLVDLPGTESRTADWCDLDGEGLPGLMYSNGPLSYQRNTGGRLPPTDSIFQPPVTLLQQPLIDSDVLPTLKDLDRNGSLDIIYHNDFDEPIGFYEREDSDTWSNFSNFPSTPSSSPSDSLALDLTGRGLGDLLFTLNDSMLLGWRESLGKEGISTETRFVTPLDASRPPRIARAPNCSAIAIDMTGDGHPDLVEIRDACVTYWMNVGNGTFGEPVDMANSPSLPDLQWASSGRVHFIDVDGSGTADIVHLLPTGGAMVYYNQSGNSWSAGSFIHAIPFSVLPSSFFTLDILGRGTASICWVDPSEPNAPTSIEYLDLMCGRKPHIMQSYTNGLGLITTIQYTPSTSYYLDDLATGMKWTTKLGFPVQCVNKVVVEDSVAGSVSTTTYRYHNGAYDALEKQFAGFEMVEAVLSESLLVGASDELYHSPSLLTKSWYNVGLSLHVDAQHFFSVSKVASCLSARASADFRPDVLFALRGAKVRVESFDHEGQAHPLQIEELAYDVDVLQTGEKKGYSVTRLTSRASLTTYYDGDIADPRVEHDIVLKCNSWGDIEQSLSIVYPRNAAYAQRANSPSVCKNQMAGNVSWARSFFTNDVLQGSDFRKAAAWRHQDYEVLNFPVSDVLSVDAARAFDFAGLPVTKGNGSWMALRKEERLYFLDERLETRLPAGKIEMFSLPDQTFSRTFSSNMVDDLSAGVQLISATKDLKQTFIKSGYVMLDEDGAWWRPSPTVSFGPELGASTSSVLSFARQSFFSPNLFKDGFGNTTKVRMDKHFLLIDRLEDPMGNVMTFEYDMSHMVPNKITDANGISQQVQLDALGRSIATATFKDDSISIQGDRLDQDPAAIVGWPEATSILEDPTGTLARSCLGGAGTRTMYVFNEKQSLQPMQPHAMVLQLSRNLDCTHADDDLILYVDLSYLNGQGAVMQRLQLADPGSTNRTWKVEITDMSTFSRQMERTFQPFLTQTPRFVSPDMIPAHFSSVFNDARGRCVAKLAPDHTWSKTLFTPWSKIEYDAGNTICIDDPAQDPVVGRYFKRVRSNHYLPSWLDVNASKSPDTIISAGVAASMSKVYSGGSTETLNGCCGLPMAEIKIAGKQDYSKTFAYDFSGNLTKTFDTLGRLVEKNRFDGDNRVFSNAGMDNGEQWSILDITDKPRLTWDSRGVSFEYEYDKLGREVAKLMSENLSVPKTVVKTIYGELAEDPLARNLRGEVWKVYDQSGIVVNQVFDIRRNCTQKSFFLAQEYKQTLDWSSGNATLDEPFESNFTFDSKGQQIGSVNAKGERLRTSFSRLGQVTMVERSEGFTETVPTWQGYLLSAQYAADGQPEVKSFGNGATTTYTYDELTRKLIGQKTTLVGKSSSLENLTMVYDCLGRQVLRADASEQDRYFRNCKIKPQWQYTYDAVGQLVSARGRGQMPAGTGGGNRLEAHSAMTGMLANRGLGNGSQLYEYEESYAYDPAGNLVQMRHAPSTDTTISGWTRSYYYEAPSTLSKEPEVYSNRLTRTKVGNIEEHYSYDGIAGSVGCMTKMPGKPCIKWNMDNLMSRCSNQLFENGIPETTYYVYDCNGRRVRKVTERAAPSDVVPARYRDTIFLDNVEIQSTFKSDGYALKTTRYLSSVKSQDLFALIESAEPGAEKENSRLVRYQIGNNMELDDIGQLISYEEYSPFGTITYTMRQQEVEAPRKYRHAQYEHDEESGFLHCEKRYYCPWLGRWTSPDPLGIGDGPNVYSYVSNDPINWVDPEGTSKRQVVPINNEHQTQPDGQGHGQARIHPVKTADRRDALRGEINDNLDPLQEFDLNKAIKDSVYDGMTKMEKFKEYIHGNKKELAVKAGAYLAVEGLKMIPIPILGTALSKALDTAVNKWEKDKKLMAEVSKQRNEFANGSKSGQGKEARAWQAFIQKAIELNGSPEHVKDTMTKAMLVGRELAEEYPVPLEMKVESLDGMEESQDLRAAKAMQKWRTAFNQKEADTNHILRQVARKHIALRSK